MAVLCSVPRDASRLLGEPIVAGMARDVTGCSSEATRSDAQPSSRTDTSSASAWAGGLIGVTSGNDEATLYGFFRAESSGAAQQFLDRLRNTVESSQSTDCEERLSDALHSCQARSSEVRGLVGGAVLLQGTDLAYVALDSALVGVRTFDGTRRHTEILADPTDPPEGSLQGDADELVLPQSAQSTDSAFGSLIAVDRAALNKVAPALQFGCLPIDTKRLYLVMGINATDKQCSFASIKERIDRAMEADSQGSAFQILSPELAPQQYSTGVYSLSSGSPELQSEQGSESFQSKLSFKDLYDHTPFQGNDDATQRKALRSSASYSDLAHPPAYPTGRDHTEMLSSPSRLVEPSMTIPEDVTLPQESMAGQLPPPLLAPIRKAYPSSQEITITPDMLSSPSPIRKAKIGKAASFNSPNGLWMPGHAKRDSIGSPSEIWPLLGQSSFNMHHSPARNDSGPLRERHSHGGNSFGAGAVEERVRGGLPRPTSSSHLSMYGGTSLTPTDSLSASPDHNQLLSESAHSSWSLQEQAQEQVKEAREELLRAPWNAPVPKAGRKCRGRSAALRMLRSNDENRRPINQTSMPNSAPAGILADDHDSPDNNTKVNFSIGSRASGNSGSRMSVNTNDSPRDSNNDVLSRTASATSSGGSRTVLCVQPLSEIGNKQSQTRTTTVTFASAPRLFQNPFHSDEACGPKSQDMYSHNRRSDSADNTMSDQFRLEGRQRSGMAFSPSKTDRLGDSVRSLTLTEG